MFDLLKETSFLQLSIGTSRFAMLPSNMEISDLKPRCIDYFCTRTLIAIFSRTAAEPVGRFSREPAHIMVAVEEITWSS